MRGAEKIFIIFVSCVHLCCVLGLACGVLSGVVLFIGGGDKCGDGACVFAKVGNCLLKVLL